MSDAKYSMRYTPLDIRLAILKHDIRRVSRMCRRMDAGHVTDALAYLDQLVNGINIPDAGDQV